MKTPFFTRMVPARLAILLQLGGFLAVCPKLATAQSQAGEVGTAGVGSNTSGRPVPRGSPMVEEHVSIPLLTEQRTPLTDLLPIYFPAIPPVLGAPLPPAPAIRDAIWTELAPHANELFFAPLSTRLAAPGNLSRRQRQRLDAYQAERSALLAELRAGMTDPARLAELARTQEAKLVALTATADELRRELYQGGFRSGNGDWNAHRNWRLGETTSKRTPQEQLYDEISVLRAAIYYQEGLSVPQRRLLREVVIALVEALGEGAAPPSLADSFEPQQVIFFLPHSARVNVPSGVPPELAAEIAAFTAEKAALKRELRDAIVSLDPETRGRRERALRELAARHEPRFLTLEPMAERIREGLGQLPNPQQPAAHRGLPAALATRIDAYLREKADLQKAAHRAAGPGMLTEFEEKNRARFTALSTEARAIREEVARVAAATGGSVKSVDTLLADFMTAFKQQHLLSLHENYRAAVMRPGLSPLQRQLLFDAGLAAFDLTGDKDWQAVPE
jgi:hypothetical protein